MTKCRCRCHAYGDGASVTCDVGPEQPGGNRSCTPVHDAVDEVPLEEACILGHPEPVAREFGYACRRHYHWIDRTLQQIEELFALTDDVLLPGPSGDPRSGTRVGSPAPGNVGIMALTDGRARPVRQAADEDDDLIPDLPGTLASWTRLVIEERETTDEFYGTVSESVRILRRERLWIVQQEWLDDYAGELHDLHRAVSRAVGDTMWPKPIGKCPNCSAPIYPTIGVDEAHCRRCKASWTGVHVARLRLIHESEGA